MSEAVDISFYDKLGLEVFEAPKMLEVPMDKSSMDASMDNANDVVTVDLVDDIPEDPTDLTTFLVNERAAPKYWVTIAAAYANKGLYKEAQLVANAGLEEFKGGEQVAVFHTFLAWLYIRQARRTASQQDKKSALLMALESTKLASGYNVTLPLSELAKAEILYMDGRDSEALRAVDTLSSMGEYPYAQVYASLVKAKVAFKRRRFNDSLKRFQAVLVEQPLIKPDPRIGIGLSFWALKDKKLAVQAWNRSLQIDPNNEVTKLLLTLSKFDTSFNSVSDEDFTKNYMGALESLGELLKNDADSPISLLLLASYSYSKGDHDQVAKIAEKVLNSTIDSDVALSDAHFWLGRVNFDKGNFTDAQRHFKDSTELNQLNLLSHLGHIQSLYKRNEIQDAIFTAESLIKKHEKIAELHYMLGMLYTTRVEASSVNDQKKDASEEAKAIASLQEYIKLAEKNNEPVAVAAYLALSRFSENKDNLEALKYLSKAVENFQRYGEAVPSQLLNNMGVFHFIQGNAESAHTFFKSASECDGVSKETGITLSYNLARSLEGTDEQQAISTYDSILNDAPGYTYATMRLLFLELIKGGRGDELDAKVDALLASDDSNLEVRAFYSWYLKKSGRGNNNGLENSHNKDTLTKHDSHDTYALISLANMYRTIAREIKPKGEQEQQKKKTSYHRAAQLFHKALSTDPRNAFAAQGIAIIFAEEKKQAQALEIFRRVRDSVDNYSVHVNLGHCLCELSQYSKAIQEYQIALARFSDETKDSRTLSLIGRAWFLRGGAEKSLESYFKALELSIRAFDVAEKTNSQKVIPTLKFNIAFVKFNIAQFVLKLDISKRTVSDINKAIDGLDEAIESLNELADAPNPPVASDMLKQRATMGSNTLKKQLERLLKEQEEFESKFKHKIEEALRVREVEKAKAEHEEQKRREEDLKKEAELKEEYERLQQQAKEWEADREQLLVIEDDEKKSKKKKKNAIWTDDEASGDEGEEKPKKKKGKKAKRKTGDATGEGEGEDKTPKKRKLTKVSAKVKSAEMIEDSDEDMGDYDESKLDDDDALEKLEAKIDEVDDEVDNDDDLF